MLEFAKVHSDESFEIHRYELHKYVAHLIKRAFVWISSFFQAEMRVEQYGVDEGQQSP